MSVNQGLQFEELSTVEEGHYELEMNITGNTIPNALEDSFEISAAADVSFNPRNTNYFDNLEFQDYFTNPKAGRIILLLITILSGQSLFMWYLIGSDYHSKYSETGPMTSIQTVQGVDRSSFTPSQDILFNLSAIFHTSRSADGKVSLDIVADEIRWPKQRNYKITQIVKGGVRSWSMPVIRIYAGDLVEWSWSTNENIASCDSNGQILPPAQRHIYSGPLGGIRLTSFRFRFTSAGTYFYTSENSQSMFGGIIVLDPPSIRFEDFRHTTGELRPIPSGIQKDLKIADVKAIDGCWDVCYDESFVAAITKDTDILAKCDGSWIFMAAYTNSDPDTLVLGAFARKDVFKRSLNTPTNYGVDIKITTVKENGVYWFQIKAQNYNYHTYGFSSISNPYLSWNYAWNECVNAKDDNSYCSDSMSWGSESNNCIACKLVNSNTYTRAIYTNTCDLALEA